VFTWASSRSTPSLCVYLRQMLVQHQSPRKHLEDAATIFLQTSFPIPSTTEYREQNTGQIQRPLIKHYRNITAVISTQCFDSCLATGWASRPTCAMKHKDLLLGDPVLSHHHHTTTVLRPFFLRPPRWPSARRELLDFMVQGEINRGRHTDHPAGCHSIRTNQCPPPPSPHIFYRPDALPTAQPTVSKLDSTQSYPE